MKEQFIEYRFRANALEQIARANEIIAEYAATGDQITLRQLYYQFVARGLLPNTMRHYKNLGATINNARLAGLVDWNAIEDRTRGTRTPAHWDSPADILLACASSYAIDRWDDQPVRVFVWIEKEALEGVVERPCAALDVPFLSCRGYLSQSEAYTVSKRFEGYKAAGQHVVVLHLGDHDPSGIDMTRDNDDRLELLTRGAGVEVRRIALNMDQVEELKPPPNPAKITDSRAGSYIRKFGRQSWELDAIDPKALRELVEMHVRSCIEDDDAWEASAQRQAEEKNRLRALSQRWDVVDRWLAKK